jgi:glycosyltransferase involved in cell wall biosynthesis
MKMNSKFANEVAKMNPKDLVIVGSVGELHHIKGYDYALRAIHDLNKKLYF